MFTSISSVKDINTHSHGCECVVTDLSIQIIAAISEKISSGNPSTKDVRLANKILTSLIADEDNIPNHQRDLAFKLQSLLKDAYPDVLPRLYKTGREIFTGRKLYQGSRCSVCVDPIQRREIDSLLASGMSYRKVASLYHLSEGAVGRHARLHMQKGAGGKE